MKCEQAEKDVNWSMCSAGFLCDQWQVQVKSQTKLLPRVPSSPISGVIINH